MSANKSSFGVKSVAVAFVTLFLSVFTVQQGLGDSISAKPTFKKVYRQEALKAASLHEWISFQLHLKRCSADTDSLILEADMMVTVRYDAKNQIIFLQNRTCRNIDTAGILIVDEADMTLEYGFLDDIDAFAGRLKEDLQMMAFSATMPDQLRPFIRKYMHSPVTFQIGEKVRFNPDIRHILVPCYHHDYADVILNMMPGFQPYVCLIFANTRAEASEIAESLRKKGITVTELHGDLTSRQRKQSMKDLASGKNTYVVATDLAARGIDIDMVTHVISCGFPENLEYYVHRAGRTGRAGASGTCYALYRESDDAAIRSLKRYGIAFDHMRWHKNTWQTLHPYGQKRLKKDDEIEKEISRIMTKKNTKVKPGYKKKRAREIERIHRKKKREFIRTKIREEKKAMYKERQIRSGDDE